NLTATLSRGQFAERIVKTNTEVIATAPILVGQYSTSIFYDPPVSGKADPFLMIIPPYTQFLNHYTITTPPSSFAINFVNAIAPTNALGSITLDGTPLATSSFSSIGVSGFSGAQIPLGVGSHTLDGPTAFGVLVYGYAQDEGYGYPGGMNTTKVFDAINLSLAPETATHPINTSGCVAVTATDQNQIPLGGRNISFSISGVNPATTTVLSDAAGQAQLCYVGLNPGTDQIAATLGSSQATATLVWTRPNQPPTVDAGTDQTITLPANAGLQGSVTDDGLPGNLLSVAWAKASGPGNVVFGALDLPVTPATFSVPGLYFLRLSPTDAALTAAAEVQILVRPSAVNQPPVADAGPDQRTAIQTNLVANGGNDATLDAGKITHWTIVEGSGWTSGNSSTAADFPSPQYGNSYFFAGRSAQAELRQDIDVSAFTAGILASTQKFEFKAYLRSAAEP